MSNEAKVTTARYPYRIQARLDGAARKNLDTYRAAKGGLSISEAVRALCMGAQVRPTRGAVAHGGILRRNYEAEAADAARLVPFQVRMPLRPGRKRGDDFYKFFMERSDIGVRLDQACWDRLYLFAERRGLTLSEAVRALCVESVPRFVGAVAGRRDRPNRWEADPWED